MTTEATSISSEHGVAPAQRTPRGRAAAVALALAAVFAIGAVTWARAGSFDPDSTPVANGGQWGGPKRTA